MNGKNFETRIMSGIYNLPSDYYIYMKDELEKFFVDPKDFEKWWKISSLLEEAVFVDYYGWSKEQDTFFYNEYTWIISQITEKPLKSDTFRNCVWLVVIWKDKETWKNIAFLTHNNPTRITWKEWNIFRKYLYNYKLKQILNKIKNKCVENSIDVVALWWNDNYAFQEYKEFIEFLNKNTKKILWINLDIAWWPSINSKSTMWEKSIIVDTKNRKIHFFKEYFHPWTNIDTRLEKTNKDLEKIFDVQVDVLAKKLFEQTIDVVKKHIQIDTELQKIILKDIKKMMIENVWWSIIEMKYKNYSVRITYERAIQPDNELQAAKLEYIDTNIEVNFLD